MRECRLQTEASNYLLVMPFSSYDTHGSLPRIPNDEIMTYDSHCNGVEGDLTCASGSENSRQEYSSQSETNSEMSKLITMRECLS